MKRLLLLLALVLSLLGFAAGQSTGSWTIVDATGLKILPLSGDGFMLVDRDYINFDATAGSSGFGFRDNAGALEYKDSGGSWIPLTNLPEMGVNETITGAWVFDNQAAIQVSPYSTGAGQTSEARFLELAANGTNYVGFKSADLLGGNQIWVLPTADGSTDDVLKTDGAGALAWSGVGDVVGPGSSTDNAVSRFSDTTGKVLENSTVTISDAGLVTIPAPGTVDPSILITDATAGDDVTIRFDNAYTQKWEIGMSDTETVARDFMVKEMSSGETFRFADDGAFYIEDGELIVSGTALSSFAGDVQITGDISLQTGSQIEVYQGSNEFIIFAPTGANYRGNGSETGAIEITLPASSFGKADMIRLTVDLYEHDTISEVATIYIAAYQYQGAAANAWINESATVVSNRGLEERDYAVRFGDDGTNAKIWIGELASTWDYVQVVVSRLSAHYSADLSNYGDDWDITLEATTFDNVEATITNTLVVARSLDVPSGDSMDFTIGGTQEGAWDATGLGVGTDTPLFNVDVVEDGDRASIIVQTFSDTADDPSRLMLEHSRGSFASPTATQDNDFLGGIYAGGYDTARSANALIKFEADAEWGDGRRLVG